MGLQPQLLQLLDRHNYDITHLTADYNGKETRFVQYVVKKCANRDYTGT